MLETYFANNVFYPFHDKKVRDFDYNDKLTMFGLSLSWRTLKISHTTLKDEAPHLCQVVDHAEEDWRNILLGNRGGIGPYETHLFLLDYMKEGDNVPPRFEWYVLRVYSKDRFCFPTGLEPFMENKDRTCVRRVEILFDQQFTLVRSL